MYVHSLVESVRFVCTRFQIFVKLGKTGRSYLPQVHVPFYSMTPLSARGVGDYAAPVECMVTLLCQEHESRLASGKLAAKHQGRVEAAQGGAIDIRARREPRPQAGGTERC